MNENKNAGIPKTLEDVCNEWLNMKRLIVKRSTFAKYHTTINRHIKPEVGGLLLCDITSTQINSFIYDKLTNGRLDTSGPLSSKTVRDIYTILKSIIKYAESEYGLANIARNTVLPKRKNSEYEILTVKEQKKLEESLLKDPYHPRKIGMLLCLYTGIRLGEICALRWQDIDFNRKLLYVRHTIQRIPVTDNAAPTKTCIILDSPKSNTSVRTIPLNSPIIKALELLKSNSAPETFVLTSRMDCVEPRNFQYFFHTHLKKTGLRHMNFHILRHTFASRCVEAGFDIKTLSEILGHSNTEITLNYYIHTSLDNKRKQMELLKL